MNRVVKYAAGSFHEMNTIALPALFTILILFLGCKPKDSIIPAIDQKAFSEYWMQGKAEISSYSVRQLYEGNLHSGNVNLMYMTEDFSKSKHSMLVKPSQHNEDAVRVMKLNMTKTFITGISDHSVMTSIFVPLEYRNYAHALKLTATCLDWSGQSFLQANYKGNRYEVVQFSNEGQGDKSYSWMSSTLEDEIWTRIRIAPHTLPIGEIKFVPSVQSVLLSGGERKVYDAITSLKNSTSEFIYTIEYKELDRKMEIRFEKKFPHKILAWNESRMNDLVSTGTLSTSELNDYWNYNQPKDSTMRRDFFMK